MITTEKIEEFRQQYSHIRVCHACRPKDVQSYYKEGILPSIELKDVQVDRFREVFPRDRFPELTEEVLQHSIEERGASDEDLCLAIDDRVIIERCGHYLIYGSEYLSSLVSNLPIKNPEPYRSELRKIGTPTMLKINLPSTTEYIRDGDVFQVMYRMVTEWVYGIAHSRTETCLFHYTFALTKPVPPEHICSYYHPAKIPDQQMGGRIYSTETGEYEDKGIDIPGYHT